MVESVKASAWRHHFQRHTHQTAPYFGKSKLALIPNNSPESTPYGKGGGGGKVKIKLFPVPMWSMCKLFFWYRELSRHRTRDLRIEISYLIPLAEKKPRRIKSTIRLVRLCYNAWYYSKPVVLLLRPHKIGN